MLASSLSFFFIVLITFVFFLFSLSKTRMNVPRLQIFLSDLFISIFSVPKINNLAYNSYRKNIVEWSALLREWESRNQTGEWIYYISGSHYWVTFLEKLNLQIKQSLGLQICSILILAKLLVHLFHNSVPFFF